MTNLSWGHIFPLKSDTLSLLLSYCCHSSVCFCFLVFDFGRIVTRNPKALGYIFFKKPVYWFFRSFLSKSWIHMELFGNFLCCYCAATKWNWPAAVTLFFATVPMLRICSLLSYKLGQSQKQVSHPAADCTTCLPSLVLRPGQQKGTKAKGPEHHKMCC